MPFTDAKGQTIPTIADVIREEGSKLRAAMARDGMTDACSLKDLSESRANGNRIDYYLWLGGFDRFALIGSIRADWWVHEPRGCGQSWCCCPTDRVYRKIGGAA